MKQVLVVAAALATFAGQCPAQFANVAPPPTTPTAASPAAPAIVQSKPVTLADRDREILDEVTAVAAREQETVLVPVHGTSEYAAAKADLDRAAAARADAKAHGTPDEILDTGNSFIAASERLKNLERPATSADPILAIAAAERSLIQVALDAATGGSNAVPLTAKEKSEAADDKTRFSDSGLKLATQFSIGNVPLLQPSALSLNEMGVVTGRTRRVAAAHVEAIMPPSDALVAVDGIYVRLTKYPLPSTTKGSDIPLVGVFNVIGQKHLLSKFHQPTAFVLELVDAHAVALVAEAMRELNPSSVPLVHERWVATPDAPASVRTFLAQLPELKDQHAQLLDEAIDQQTKQLAQIEREPVALDRLAVSRTFGATYTVDPAAADAKGSREEECKAQIAKLKNEKEVLQHDDLWLPPDGVQVEFRVGSIGALPRCRVVQVVNGSELMAACGDTDFWLSGVDTAGVVDDSFFTFAGKVVVSGTKQYGTVMGAQRTIWAIEPIDLKRFVVSEAVMSAPIPPGLPRLGQ